MKRSLRGSRQQPLPDMNNLNQTAQNIDPAMLNDVQSVVDKYGGKSEQELIGELAAAKRSGIIDPNELASVAGRQPSQAAPLQLAVSPSCAGSPRSSEPRFSSSVPCVRAGCCAPQPVTANKAPIALSR